MDIPVYLFTGFLEGGKTTFIQSTLEDKSFNSGENTLLLLCEEGEIEYETDKFASLGVTIKCIDDVEDLTLENLKKFQKESKAKRVIIEYNGMWQLKDLFSAVPKEWIIYQEMCFLDSSSIINYNANMRPLVVDKMNNCDLVVFNRCTGETDKMALHKIVRSVSRRAEIAYEFKDGHTEYDDIEDPLPFDITKKEIKIEDKDFALWYRDMVEEPKKYNGKIIEFLGICAKDAGMPKLEFAIGRHIMTCCEDDIQYGGLVAQWTNADKIQTGHWLRVRGKIKIEYNELYGNKGPVLRIMEAELTNPPKEKVVTFY